ncbi:hypothetical protein UT300003_32020 [Clostridium sardiniense]
MKTRCRQCRKLIDFGNTFCDECKSKITKERKKGLKDKNVEATTKSTRWKALRSKIVQRDKCCVLCLRRGFIEYRSLQVHHLVKRVDDNSLIYEPSNLVTVCRNCHEELEKLSLKEQKELLGDFNKEISFRLL